ncbi:MAG: winged helix-turn-helix domain-containing protein [Bryobacteraceae bacterium]|nr:winged helix-turn-helix domain-containing protein [Bryobacteraceae bacterium]
MVRMARFRFGLFQFNTETGALWRDGLPVHLQAQPAKVLALLVAAQGELVTREALRNAIWSDGTAVDFDRGLNFAIAQVRTALGDSADSPTFIRTVPKRGYQFLAPVSVGVTPAIRPRRGVLWWVAGAFAAGATAWVVVAGRSKEPRIAVARFQNETGNPTLNRLADTITDAVVAGLTTQTAGRYGIIGNAAILRRPRGFQNLDEIASSLRVRYVILGQVQQDGARMRLLAHLIRFPEQTHLQVSRGELTDAATASGLASHIVEDFIRRLNSLESASH